MTGTTITQAFSSFQNDFVENEKKVYTVVEEMPSFKGNVNTWLISHLRFSKRTIREGVYGRVMVKFIVKSDADCLILVFTEALTMSLIRKYFV